MTSLYLLETHSQKIKISHKILIEPHQLRKSRKTIRKFSKAFYLLISLVCLTNLPSTCMVQDPTNYCYSSYGFYQVLQGKQRKTFSHFQYSRLNFTVTVHSCLTFVSDSCYIIHRLFYSALRMRTARYSQAMKPYSWHHLSNNRKPGVQLPGSPLEANKLVAPRWRRLRRFCQIAHVANRIILKSNVINPQIAILDYKPNVQSPIGHSKLLTLSIFKCESVDINYSVS